MNQSSRIAAILGIGTCIMFAAQSGYLPSNVAMAMLLSLTLLIRFIFV
jgi:hypothetical protein